MQIVSARRSFGITSWLLVIVVLVASPPLAAQRGEIVLQQNLAELVHQAATIVRGRVVSVSAEPHPQFSNLDTVVVTLKVAELIKGEAGQEFVFRQFIFDIRDRHTSLGYKPGQEVLLLMIKPSQYGLSSPAGLEQGRFRILRDPDGNRIAVNGFDNLGLFRNIQETAPNLGLELTAEVRQLLTEHWGGPIPYDQLVQIIRGAITASAQR